MHQIIKAEEMKRLDILCTLSEQLAYVQLGEYCKGKTMQSMDLWAIDLGRRATLYRD